MGTQRFYYRDFDTNERHYTRGVFVKWAKLGRIINVYHAVFKRAKSYLYIPVYLLEPETLAALPPRPNVARDALTEANSAAEASHEWGMYGEAIHSVGAEWVQAAVATLCGATTAMPELTIYRRYPLRPAFARLDD